LTYLQTDFKPLLKLDEEGNPQNNPRRQTTNNTKPTNPKNKTLLQPTKKNKPQNIKTTNYL
jgi:hypothetical protein